MAKRLRDSKLNRKTYRLDKDAYTPDRVIRSVPGKMITAKALAGTGEALQSPVTQAAGQAAGRSAQGSAQNAGEKLAKDWVLFRSSEARVTEFT